MFQSNFLSLNPLKLRMELTFISRETILSLSYVYRQIVNPNGKYRKGDDSLLTGHSFECLNKLDDRVSCLISKYLIFVASQLLVSIWFVKSNEIQTYTKRVHYANTQRGRLYVINASRTCLEHADFRSWWWVVCGFSRLIPIEANEWKTFLFLK